jgi:ABC-type uncharacterized transport system permease subunit
MLTYAPSITAIVLYLTSSGYLAFRLFRVEPIHSKWLLILSGLAIAAHATGISQLVFVDAGYNLNFFVALSLITCVVNFLVAVSGLRLPVLNLFVFLFPFSVAAVAGSLVLSQDSVQPYKPGLFAHITLSVLAYALLTIAALQSCLLAWQNSQLRHKKLAGRVRLLPPLQTMETLLFDIVWTGQITLTLAIASGFVFLEDMFAQHLVHKTILSILAWAIFSVLLWGRHYLGWRGGIAIRWILSGFCLLMLAYFGSKLVLEFILGR